MFLKDRSQSESLGLLGWEILHPLMEQLHKILKYKTHLELQIRYLNMMLLINHMSMQLQ